ncbi:MAG: hypothetical protein CBB60_001285 [Armatimonadetes bacterium Cent15-Ar3]|nr:MAG: hypothetical protein CBB60_001285 [Armatimonadetes bacterium Cent15-Ar3]
MSTIDFDIKGVGAILSSGKLTIPSYQRSYSWGEQQVKEFYEDIYSAQTIPGAEYFLGGINLQEKANGILEVIDGQQRLTTAVLFFAAVRDELRTRAGTEPDDRAKVEHNASAEKISKDFLSDVDRWASVARTPKLSVGNTDKDFFESAFLEILTGDEPELPIPTKPSHAKLQGAYDTIGSRLRELDIETIRCLTDFLDDRVKVFLTKFKESTNPFEVFETLNNRGITLSLADRIKNHLLGKSQTRMNSVSADWGNVVAILESESFRRDDEILDTFLRHFWMSQTGAVVRSDALFEDFKKRVTSPEKAVSTAKAMKVSAKHYRDLLRPSKTAWQAFGHSVCGDIEFLNILGAKQIRPVILAMLSNFKVAEVARSLSNLTSTAVRIVVSGRAGSGSIEKWYASIAHRISEKKITNSNGLAQALLEKLPTDVQFEQSFASYPLTKMSIARRLLAAIEEYESQPAGTLVVTPNIDEVNVEHVLPKKPTTDSRWLTDFPDTEAYVHRLGNMVLLQAKVNRRIANLDFAHKRQRLIACDYQTTKSVGQCLNWTPAELEKRQLEMAKSAIKIWKVG